MQKHGRLQRNKDKEKWKLEAQQSARGKDKKRQKLERQGSYLCEEKLQGRQKVRLATAGY